MGSEVGAHDGIRAMIAGSHPRCAAAAIRCVVALAAVSLALASCSVVPDERWRGPAGVRSQGPPHAGSGVIVGEAGYVLTHRSVTAGAERLWIEIALQDRRNRRFAQIARTDPKTGLVLLKAPVSLDRLLPWRHGSSADGEPVTAVGWPLLGAIEGQRHDPEVSSCSGAVVGGALSFALGPGYEGGPVVDRHGDGIGLVAEVTGSGGLRRRASVVPVAEVRRFLSEAGLQVRAPIGSLRRSWRIRLSQLQNSTVGIEREPARLIGQCLPELAWRTRLPVDDIVTIEPPRPNASSRRAEVIAWTAGVGSRSWWLDLAAGRGSPAAGPESDKEHEAADASAPRFLVTAARRYTVDGVGRLSSEPISESRGPTVGGNGPQQMRDLVALNGLRRFWSRGAFETDGRGLMLVGDALVVEETGTALFRINIRPGEPSRLYPREGLLIGRRYGGNRQSVELWRLPNLK